MQTASLPVNHIVSELDFSHDFEIRKEALDALTRRLTEAPADTRRALAQFTPLADPYQLKVIEARDHTIRILAPAGSGKTQTVVNRVVRRVQEGLNPNRLLVLTFDRAATTVLRARLTSQMTSLAAVSRGLTISTLNAFGYDLLRQHFPEECKGIVPAYRQRRLLREVRARLEQKSAKHVRLLPGNIDARYYIEFFSLLKNELFDPRQPRPQQLADFVLSSSQGEVFLELARDSVSVKLVIEALIWLYQTYELALQRDRVMDFDDQKLRAYTGLLVHEDLRDRLQRQYTEIIVDEFQDINRLDFALVTLLAAQADLVVTGDDDQAIYGFRGCTPDFIIDLEAHLSRPVASHELRVNYRCPANLVHHADQLIRHNTRRVPKDPVAHNETSTEIKVVSTLSAGIEAQFVVDFLRGLKRSQPALGYQDFAILYRTNAQSLPLQVELILNDVPYYVREQDNILTNDALLRLLSVLRCKQALGKGEAPTAGDAAQTIRAYFRYMVPETVRRLEHLFGQTSPFRAILVSEDFYRLVPKARKSQVAAAVDEMLAASTLMNTLDVLAKRFKGLRGMLGSLEDVVAEQAPLGEIYELAANFRGDLGNFVNVIETALARAREADVGTDREQGVALLTYFRSKGLQWHTVILTTCNEGLIPHRKASLEDERRLFYVAMTRASSNLLISYVKSAAQNPVAPSRFLVEAGLIADA